MQTGLELRERQGAGNAADVAAALGALLGGERVVGDDVGAADAAARLEHARDLAEDGRLVRCQVRDGSLQLVPGADGQPQPASWTEAWGLVTEPFVAVVDDQGTVRAKFEGTIAADELVEVIEAL